MAKKKISKSAQKKTPRPAARKRTLSTAQSKKSSPKRKKEGVENGRRPDKQKAQKLKTASKTKRLLKASTSSEVEPSKWIQTKAPFSLPEYVRTAINRLNSAGFVAYVVGGSVRDFLLDREAKDHDLATDALPEQLKELFPNAIHIGLAFGVIKIPPNTLGEHSALLEIATFRRDMEYEDFRHPKEIAFTNVEEDAQRRDFSVNAFYFDLKTQKILDPCEGMKDIEERQLRAIGDPHKRFQEDALRLLRAIRFATTLDFKIELETRFAIKSRANLIKKVSSERIHEELTRMLTGTRPAEALELIRELELLPFVLQELHPLLGLNQSEQSYPEIDVWEQTLRMLEIMEREYPDRGAPLSWAVLLQSVGKPVVLHRNRGRNFNGHEIEGAIIAERICEGMRMSSQDSQLVSTLIREHLKFVDVFQMRESTLIRWIRSSFFEELLKLHRIVALASDGNLAFYEYAAKRLEMYRASPEPKNYINGDDLIQLGIQPGPEFSRILKEVEDLSLEGEIHSKEDALEYVIKNYE